MSTWGGVNPILAESRNSVIRKTGTVALAAGAPVATAPRRHIPMERHVRRMPALPTIAELRWMRMKSFGEFVHVIDVHRANKIDSAGNVAWSRHGSDVVANSAVWPPTFAALRQLLK
jgi:hypothetical protein